jgi:uncharacterized protein
VKNVLRATAVAGLSGFAAIALAVPALAHVEVSGIDTTQGGEGVLTFRVPSESDTASTTELRVTLPDDSPILQAATQPKAGWTATVTKKNLPAPVKDDDGDTLTQYASVVDWKADTPQAAIPPNDFDMFNLLVGPLPKSASVSFPAQQFYSDGTIVNWNEKAADGQPEPDHPTPTLTLSADTDSAPPASAATTGTAPANVAPAMAMPAAPASAPTWPGVVGLVVAIVAVLLGVANFALLRRSKSVDAP